MMASQASEAERARDALHAISPDLPRDEWVRTLMAAHAAGVSQDDAELWSSRGASFNQRDFRDTWRSIKPGGGIGAGSLFAKAMEYGWTRPHGGHAAGSLRAVQSQPQPASCPAPADLFERFAPAREDHPYIVAKQGRAEGLRVVPPGDPLRIAGESMGGALVVPVKLSGAIQTLQLIAPPETAERLKAAGKPAKLNLPGHSVQGWFTVGNLLPAATVYVCEGIGQAWACWKATGRPAVVCFGWGRVRAVAKQLRGLDPAAILVLVPDVGKETQAEQVAGEVGAQWVKMPAGWPQNSDVNDLAQRDGYDVLEALLSSPTRGAEGARPRPLDFAALATRQPPPRHWFVPGWLGGPTLLAGPGGCGKSSLEQHLATMGALGRSYIAQIERPFKSLVWNCEDEHDELWRRQEQICAHEQIDMASLQGRLHIVSRYGCDNALMQELQGSGLVATPLMKELREQVNDLDVEVLWLDNVAHLFLGDHDDRTHVTSFINALNGLVTGRPFAVVIVAHPGKAAGSEYSGSVAWENAVRMRWFLGNRLPDQQIDAGEDEGVDRSKVRFLCKRKTNYSAQDFVRFTMDHGLLVPDHEPVQEGTSGMLQALDEKRAEELCLAGFRSLVAMGLHPSDAPQAADFLPKQLVAKGLASGYTKTQLTRAMNRLMAAGIFVRAVVSKHSNRTDKWGLKLQGELE